MTGRRAWTTIGLVLALACVMAAQAGVQNDKQYQAALQKEMVAGDLKAAIEMYRTIAERPGVERSLAATALLRMAECYQKLGNDQARTVLTMIVNRYGDLPVATQARAKLTAFGPASATRASQAGSVRTVWSGPKVSNGGVVSRDGRWLPYTDWSTGNLALHDLTNNRDLTLTDTGRVDNVRQQQYADHSCVSPDGKRVAFGWFNSERYEVRLVDIEPTGSKPRTLFINSDVDYIQPFDWSPDGQSLVVELRRGDAGGQIALLSVPGGVLTPLKSFTWRSSSSHAAFSPNGRHIGYDLPSEESPGERDVYALAVDGSREVRVTAHTKDDRMVGWSSDGTSVIFSSDRTGSRQLWAQAWSGLALVGTPQVIPSSFSGTAVGVTRDEALFERTTTFSNSLFRTVPFDFEMGVATGAPTDPGEEFFSTNLRSQAEWSPDGLRLALIRRDRGEAMGMLVSILDLTSRRVTNVRPQLSTPGDRMVWAPDGRSFFSTGLDLKNRQGLFRVAIDSGEVARLTDVDLAADRRVGTGLAVSTDGTEVYSRQASPAGIRIFARHVDSGRERDLATWPGLATGITDHVGRPSISPDGRHIATVMTNSATEASVVLIDVASGQLRTLKRGAASMPELLMWAPDNRSVFVRWTSPEAGREVWRVPTAGGDGVRVNWTLGHDNREFRVHPDGRRLVYVVNAAASQTEVRVLPNLLSSAGR